MPKCECGCGLPANSTFLPGHDQRLRTSLEKRAGGLLSLKTLVQTAESYTNGKESDHSFLQRVRAIFA